MADVIDRLEEASEPRQETWSGTATVTGTDGAFPDGRQKITVSWQDQDVDCAYLASYVPVIGDQVIFLKNGSSFFVLGTPGFDTGWQAVTVNSPFAALSGEEPQVRKIGRQVWMRGAITNAGVAASTNYTGVMTVPSGFRPPTGRPVVLALGSSSGAATASGHVRDTGDVWLRTTATVGSYYAYQTTWLLD